MKRKLEDLSDDEVYVTHGRESHLMNERWKCKECMTLERWFKRRVEKAGGMEKFIEQLKKEEGD